MDSAAVGEEVVDAAKSAGGGVATEFGRFGKTLFTQLLGIKDNENLSTEDLDEKTKDDEKFSKEAHAEMVQQIYEQYRHRRKKELQIEDRQEEQEKEAEKLTEINQLRASNDAVNAAASKGSAETGRNWGSE